MNTINIVSKTNPKQIIRLSSEIYRIYGREFIENFDYFFSSVFPENIDGYEVIDFSQPKSHNVVGYDLHPIYFPTASEPIATAFQYLDFSELTSGGVALDLGAYSGLTSILFKERVGKEGRVIAVDADEVTLDSTIKNFKMYKEATGNEIDLCYSAVWTHNDGITFCSEGAMGSYVSEILGARMVQEKLVPSVTLLQLAKFLI